MRAIGQHAFPLDFVGSKSAYKTGLEHWMGLRRNLYQAESCSKACWTFELIR
jgi:hypothetical protein